ncbi:hypothetical protein IFM58399_00180 [Aspergillus lentulus]|uniref:DSC E3 ubiquitin ligase complex subunit 2 n=1 Tax=Aspergillus lentulus TaxID=293939 RepID=A0ABQ0ZR46_ASPLE|nr:uncharacterized protein IFM58399_00180 [Aspergillus lentulus]KAF4169592.1 hypothetical protein CNMCM6936_007575 [Aspergillus lentulus]KAF4175149.1 hypothetical protein CNMCM8060_007747 [Aspergillus lentulus]KAF4195301.1 hypothetical protein CNMCM8694_006487 [Aspergillus lentulus]GFF23124.1 hypothetical protein IFM58399_00180 [Aspergillus lentulus]GFF51979.1 hypothetical protein IFM62136_01936 [Aspergillus lentulus]
MLTSGLTNAPITKLLLIYTIASSIALSILDIKYLASIRVSPHLWPYAQFWRLATWQLAGFANSTEALFAAMLAYHLRVVERAWGKRKFATFILSTLPYTSLLPPLLLVLLRPLTLYKMNYLPCGPTATLFALLAQYHAGIPHTFRYRISTSTSTSADTNERREGGQGKYLTLLLSDKSTTYLVAAQLALSQFPGMMLPAVVGWVVGVAWRAEVLPLPTARWRVPAWVVGEKEIGRRGNQGEEGGERYEDLRRRLEGEAVAAAAASGNAGVGLGGEASGQRQRRREGGIMDRLRAL